MKHVVTIGGGTGTFVVLSALKGFTDVHRTAIVTAADDGGSTGRLRDAYGFLPPGDVRQALVALADDGDRLRDLFAYRFEKGDMQGHSLGNLFLTALTDLLGSNTAALEEASRILRIRGEVIPATEEAATLAATFTDGSVARGQEAVSEHGTHERHVADIALDGAMPLTPGARDAIARADLIVLGPGLLYSSTVAALLAEGTADAIRASSARILYVANLFTKAGETDGYALSTHVAEVERYAGRAIDAILVNDAPFTPEVLAWYANEKEYPLQDDLGSDIRVTRVPLASTSVVPPLPGDPIRRSLMRHDPALLASAIAPFLRTIAV